MRQRIEQATGHAPLGGRNLYGNFQSDGVITDANYQTKHRAMRAVEGVRLVFTNVSGASESAYTPANAITVKAAVEYPAGNYHPVFFNGKRDVVIDSGGMVVGELVGVSIPADTDYWVRTRVVVTGGQKWPTSLYSVQAEEGAGTTDKVDSGTIATSAVDAYAPAVIWTLPQAQGLFTPVVAIIGDSIASGLTPTNNVDDGLIQRALNTAKVPWVNLGAGGEAAYQMDVVQERRIRAALLRGCTHAIVHYGTNDFAGGRTAVQITDALAAIGTWLNNQGIVPYVCTIPPRSTSSDSWATTVNQTTHASNSVRVTANATIRAALAPYAGFFEVADLLESARDSGIWKASHTADGIHPNATGQAAADDAITTSVLVA